MSLQAYENTLATIKDPAMDRTWTGWVMPDSDGVLVLELVSKGSIPPGPGFEITLSTLAASLQFRSSCIGVEGQFALFSIPTALARHPGIEQSRFRGIIGMGRIAMGKVSQLTKIESVGLEHLNLIFPEPLMLGTCARVFLKVNGDTLEFDVKVVGGREFAEEPGMFLVETEIGQVSRTDAVRWRRALSAHRQIVSEFDLAA